MKKTIKYRQNLIGLIKPFLKKGWRIERCRSRKKISLYDITKIKVTSPEDITYTKESIKKAVPFTEYDHLEMDYSEIDSASKFLSIIEEYFSFKRKEYKLSA